MVKSGIRALDVMTREVVIASPQTPIDKIAKLMNEFRIGGLPVVEGSELVGMITERDIMRKVIALNKRPGDVNVGDVMTSPPKAIVQELEDMNSITQKMVVHDVTRLPVVNKEGKLVGIVTNRDILRNSHEMIDVLIEQAKIKGKLDNRHTAFGQCELCGESGHLIFKGNNFVCDECATKPFKLR